MKVVLVLAIVAALAVATAAVSSQPQVVYTRKTFPSDWKLSGLPLSTEKIRITFALKQRNLDVLEKKFWAVATPGNPEYRNFMSREDILDIVAPSPHDKALVVNFLHQNGVKDIVDRRDNLLCHTTVEVAEKMFNTTFYKFSHVTRKNQVTRQMGSYSLPKNVIAVIDFVTGVSDFPSYPKRKAVPASPDVDGYIVPASLNSVYNVPAGTSSTGSEQGVVEFGAGQDYDAASLQYYAKEVGVDIPALEPSHVINPQPPSGVEGTLDIDYLAGVGQGGDNWYWTENDWLYDWATTFFAAADVPDLVSVSYGWAEYDQCDISDECTKLGVDSEGFVLRVNAEFQKIGLRGISIIVASGDSGANGRTDPDCTDKVLHPDYPACSPYVTSVGATQLQSEEFKLSNPPPICKTYQCASNGTESAVSYSISSFTSGGGFSNYAAQPSYQSDVVSEYLASGVVLPPESYFNKSGRAYPDVAALGHNFLVYDSSEGGFFAVGGTSAASPTFAAFISFLNAIAKKKDGKPLGFLNPLIYQMYAAQPNTFRDITVGDNICTEDGCSAGCKGFRCTKGWDPVTGLGVPDVAEMIDYINANL